MKVGCARILAALFVGCVVPTGCSRLLSLGNTDALTPASTDDCEKFGHELEQAVADDDAAKTTELIGIAGQFRRGTADFLGVAGTKGHARHHPGEGGRT